MRICIYAARRGPIRNDLELRLQQLGQVVPLCDAQGFPGEFDVLIVVLQSNAPSSILDTEGISQLFTNARYAQLPVVFMRHGNGAFNHIYGALPYDCSRGRLRTALHKAVAARSLAPPAAVICDYPAPAGAVHEDDL